MQSHEIHSKRSEDTKGNGSEADPPKQVSKLDEDKDKASPDKPKLKENHEFTDFALWKINSPEYYWWHKKLIYLKKVEERNLKEAEEVFFMGDNESLLSYKDMNKIEQEQNQILNQVYTNNKINSSMMVRTNSKVSQNTNTLSNGNGNKDNAKAIMRSMLKKKSTMLFIQPEQIRFQDIKTQMKKEDSVPISATGNTNTLVRTTTLAPDFKSNLLNHSSRFKKKTSNVQEEIQNERKKSISTPSNPFKKVKSFREENTIKIIVNPLDKRHRPLPEKENKEMLNTSKRSYKANMSSKSGRGIDDFED